MKKLALLLALLLSGAAQAQTNFAMPPPAGVFVGGYQVVTTCGTGSLSTATPAFGTMDITGKLCTSGSGGGGSSSLAYVSATLTPWTSATAANATQLLMPLNTTSFGAAITVQLDQTTTISAGAVTFEGTYDGTNWVAIPVGQTINCNTITPLNNPYTLVASTNQCYMIEPAGYQSVRIKLSTQITGSGSVTPFVTLLPFDPVPGIAALNPSSPIAYETIAASQTGQVMGGSGAAGDYLSHCVLYPTSTSPGVLTVFDNTSSATNNAIAFAGGSSSLSNLVPFAIPVGANSINGPWKVTTGANMVASCFGRFSP